METSSGSDFLVDNNLENTQNLPSKGDESKVSTNNDIEESEQYDITDTYSSQKLWGIDLILKNITDYLSISDLKELSLANKNFLEKVRNISRFRSSAGQIVTGAMKIHTFNLCRAVVKVNTLDDNILQKSAADIFQNTEYLDLRNVDQPGETGSSRLIQIVANCPKLKSLTLPEMNHFCGNWEPFFTDENVKSVFSNLKELHLGFDRDYRYFDSSIPLDEVALQHTFKHFTGLQMKLRKFSFTFNRPGHYFGEYYFCPELLLRSSKETLEELEITVDCDRFDALKTMQFSKLNKLHLKFDGCSTTIRRNNYLLKTPLTPYVTDTLVQFIRNHLSILCEFELESNNEYSLTPFCELFKSSKKIEVLQFTTGSSFGKSLRSTNWDFLATNSNFRGFKLLMHRAEVEYDSENGSDTEEELEDEQEMYIRRIDKSYYVPQYLDAFPSAIECIEFRHYPCDLVEIPAAILGSSLARLKNLTSLKVINCESFLNDDIVQIICKHLTKLRIFEGDFGKVTDFGISGVRGNGEPDSGISLANLKGLKKLTLYSGQRITWRGLHKAIYFLELIELKVSGVRNNDEATSTCYFYLSLEEKAKVKSNYLILINRNPSLEHINIDVHGLPDTFDCKQFPRVKTFSRHSQSTWYADMLKGPSQ